MVSLLCLSLICLELFAAVSATRPLIERTPRRYSPIKRKLDTRIAGLLVFGRQSGPCCSNGGCCEPGEFCNGNGCCLDDENPCLDGGCCGPKEFCEDGGCCPIGEFCTGPPPGTITISRGGTFTFTSSDTLFPSTTDVFTSSKFTSHSSFSVSSGDFGGPTPFPSPTSTPLPDAGSITLSIDAGFSTTLNNNASDFPSASAGGAGGLVSAASRAGVDQLASMLIAVAILSLSGYYL